MLYHFPQPYHDELFYSILARYFKRTPETNSINVIQALFGKKMSNLGKSIPFGISNIFKQLEIFEYPSEKEIAKNHSLFYYYTNFLSPVVMSETYKQLLFGMTQGERILLNGITLDHSPRNFRNLPYGPRNFRYCPKCLITDIEQYGETYWRASFQIPTVFICQRHETLLEESTVSIHTDGLIPATKENCVSNEPKKRMTQKTILFLLLLAKESVKLAKEELNFYFEGKALLLLHLKMKGLLDRYGVVKKEELLQRLIKFYGLNFFEIIDLNPNKVVERYCEDIDYDLHLLSYLEQIVIIIFLAGNIEDFISAVPMNDPLHGFIRNPRCKNKNCQSIVRLEFDSRFEDNMRRKITTLSYSCACGMIYRCIWGEKEIHRQSEHSFYAWYKSDEFYIEVREKIYITNLSILEVAKIYNLHELEVEMILHNSLNEEVDEVLIQSFREKWSSYIKANPNKHYLQLKYENLKLFTWLYRNDGNWLKKSIEKSRYTEIDQDFLRKRDTFIKEYLRSNMHRYIICQYKGSQIIQWLRFPFRYDYLSKELELLPKSSMYAEKISHLYDKFGKRRSMHLLYKAESRTYF